MTVTAGSLAALPHRFFGREGGVSEGVWDSLNVGIRSGDEIGRVLENRARCAASLGSAADRLAVARQVHGIAVAGADTPWAADAAPDADAVVSRRRGVTVGVVTADCAPILLADADAGVIGAVHAGWRGALDGVIEATIAAMRNLGARRIAAAVGPCIARDSYEVGPDYRDRFVSTDPESAPLFAAVPGSDRLLFDLKGFCRLRLQRAGVAGIEILPDDTCADERRFFSFRRAVRRQEGRFGLQLSAIALP